MIEWWCPWSQRWELCPGPCPDGSEHELTRQVPSNAEVIRLV